MGKLLERSFPKPLPELSTHFIGSANIVPLNIGDFTCRYRRYKAFRQITSNRCGTTRGSFRPNHQLTFYHFYPGAERGVNRPNPAGRDWAREQPEIAARNTATQNPHHLGIEVKIPLVKVLESLENFFQEVFKWGSGQSPEVLGLGTESQGLDLALDLKSPRTAPPRQPLPCIP